MNRTIEQSRVIAGLYGRLSDDDDQDGTSVSIETQVKILTDYARDHGMTVYDTYTDDGFTGTNFNRPSFKRLMEDAGNGTINTIIVKDLSRFGRNYLEVGRYISELFPMMGIRFIAIGDDVDSARGSLDYDLMFPIKNIFNEYYPADCSRKTRQAFATKAKNGEFIGSKAPYGYRKSEADKHVLEIDEEIAPTVEEIFRMAAYLGYGFNKIARVLTERRVITPTALNEKRANREYNKDPYEWNLTSVRCILYNEAYLGHLISGKRTKLSFKSKRVIHQREELWVVHRNWFPALVTQQLWDDAHKALNSRKRMTASGFDNIFAGLLKCDKCGGAVSFCSGRPGEEYYTCNTYKKKGKNYCSSHYLKYSEVYKAVLADIRDTLRIVQRDKDAFVEAVLKHIDNTATKQRSQLEREARELKKRVDDLEARFDRMYEDRLNGLLSDRKFKELADKTEAEQEAARARLTEVMSILEGNDDSRERIEDFAERVLRYTDITALDREILNTLVDTITIGDRIQTPDGVEQKITVNYRFMRRQKTAEAA